MDVDAGLKIVGHYGRIQVVNIAVFGFSLLLSAVQMTSIAFTLDQSVEYFCKPPSGFSANQTTPFINKNGHREPDRCHMYGVLNGTLEENITTCQNGWEYPSDSGSTSVVTELDLVCDRSLLGSVLVSVHFAGALVGATLTGHAADVIGRRPVSMISLLLMSVFGIAASFTWNFELMLALRFLIGMFIPGNTMVSYIRIVEMFRPKQRIIGNLIGQYFWSSGVIIVAPIAYLLPQWRNFQLAVSLVCIPLLPLHWFFTYESLRWLVQRRRVDEVVVILQSIAKSKNIKYEGCFLVDKETENAPLAQESTAQEISPPGGLNGLQQSLELTEESIKQDNLKTNSLEHMHSPELARDRRVNNVNGNTVQKYTVLDLFKTKVLIKITLIIFFLWFAMDIMYFGLIIYATSLTGNKYLNFFLLAIVEAPGYCHDYFIIRRFGRKKSLVFLFLASSVACLLIGFIPAETAKGTNLTVFTVVVAMVGKFYANASYEVTMLVTAEVFPTVLRNVGQGSSATVGKIGTIVAPFILHLTTVASFLPMTIIASLAFIASVLLLLLPETRNRPLPETYEDANKLTRDGENAL